MGISLHRNDITGNEPLTLAEMKNYLKVDVTDTTDDALIQGLITAARERAEIITGRALVTSDYTYYLDAFPYDWQLNTGPARNSITRFANWWANAQAIILPKAPLVGNVVVQYMPSDNAAYVTLPSSTYTVDTTSNPGAIYPIADYYWPTAWTIHNAVMITFTAGYTQVPDSIRVPMRMLVCDWYENRGDSSVANIVAENMLKSHKSQTVGYTDR